MRAPAAFGAFGKMPALGDFFQTGVAQGFAGPWDRWVQAGMIAARAALGERWQGLFLSAPIWRFTLSAGLAGPDAALGVLMPSVDRVGRQFPLTLVTALPPQPLVALHFAAQGTFAALEQVALDALDDRMTRDALAARLAALAPPPVPGPVTAGRAGGARLLTTPPGQDLAAALAAQTLGDTLRAPSLWSADTAGGGRLLLAEGLPDPEQVQLMFDPEASGWAAPGPTGDAA